MIAVVRSPAASRPIDVVVVGSKFVGGHLVIVRHFVDFDRLVVVAVATVTLAERPLSILSDEITATWTEELKN